MDTINTTRGLWINDSGLTTSAIKAALEPAYAVLAEFNMTAEQAHAHLTMILDYPPSVHASILAFNSPWMTAERAITADLRESAVMVLA